MSKQKTYFSLFQENDYLETGINSKTRKEAIKAGIDYVKVDSTAPSRLERMSLKDKESYLKGMNIIVEEHNEQIEEVEESDNKGTQRSPFAPWS
jgi:hypothetical protein